LLDSILIIIVSYTLHTRYNRAVAWDKTTRERILEVSKFDEEDKSHIFSVIDAFIAKRKIQSIL